MTQLKQRERRERDRETSLRVTVRYHKHTHIHTLIVKAHRGIHNYVHFRKGKKKKKETPTNCTNIHSFLPVFGKICLNLRDEREGKRERQKKKRYTHLIQVEAKAKNLSA